MQFIAKNKGWKKRDGFISHKKYWKSDIEKKLKKPRRRLLTFESKLLERGLNEKKKEEKERSASAKEEKEEEKRI